MPPLAGQKNMSGLDVTVFDSLAGSLGHGLQVLKAAELASCGHSLKEILAELEITAVK